MHRQPAEMVSAGCKMLKAISIIPAVCSVCACSHCWKLPPDPPVQGLNVACLAAGTWEIHIAWVCSRHLILHQPAAWTCLRPEDQVNAHQSQSPGLLQQNNLFMALGVLPWVPDCLLGQARSQPHSPAGGGGGGVPDIVPPRLLSSFCQGPSWAIRRIISHSTYPDMVFTCCAFFTYWIRYTTKFCPHRPCTRRPPDIVSRCSTFCHILDEVQNRVLSFPTMHKLS